MARGPRSEHEPPAQLDGRLRTIPALTRARAARTIFAMALAGPAGVHSTAEPRVYASDSPVRMRVYFPGVCHVREAVRNSRGCGSSYSWYRWAGARSMAHRPTRQRPYLRRAVEPGRRRNHS